MAAGVPPAAAAGGGNPEAVDHGVNGLLFDAGDSGQLARHILTLLDNEDTRRRMGAAAVAKVRETFSFDGMIDAVESVFRDAAGCALAAEPAAPAAAAG